MWRRLDRPGHEAARLVHHAPFWQLGGTAVFLLDRPSVVVAQGVRITTYLSLAQYRDVMAAESQKSGRVHPSVPAAVGGASDAVLRFFYPGVAADL